MNYKSEAFDAEERLRIKFQREAKDYKQTLNSIKNHLTLIDRYNNENKAINAIAQSVNDLIEGVISKHRISYDQ